MNSPPAPCTLQRVSDHVWWFTPESHRDRPSLGAVVGAHGVAVLDAGASPAHAAEFLAALNAAGVGPPTQLVLTHAHWDHVFGLAAFRCPVIATRGTDARLAQMMTWDYSDAGLPGLVAAGHEIPFTAEHLPRELTDAQRAAQVLRRADLVVEASHQLDLGGVHCDVVHVGGDHADDACVIHVPEDRLLFLGDCLCDDLYHGPRHYTRARLLPLIARIEGFEAEILIEGHAGGLGGRASSAKEFALIRDAYAWLDAHGRGGGEDPAPALAHALKQRHAAEDVDGLLPPILAGL